MFSKKVTDNRSKNTKRKITKETKEIVYERDWWLCIICDCKTKDHFHHIYFGWSAIYTENRNDPDQLCLLCNQCHTLLHFDWNSNHYRQECIDYINHKYEIVNLLKNYVPNNPN